MRNIDRGRVRTSETNSERQTRDLKEINIKRQAG